MTFGQSISKRRKELEFSQKYVAEQCNISSQYLNDIEHDRRNPPKQEIIGRLAELLKLDFEVLLFTAGQWPEDLQNLNESPDRIQAAFSAFRKSLDPEN